MAEENQVMKEPQQITKEPQRVTTKDPKEVEAGKRLAAISHKKREVKKREEQVQMEKTTRRVNQYYGIGAVIVVGVIGGLTFIGPRKEKYQIGPCRPPLLLSNHHHTPRLTSLRWIQSLLYYKNGQEEYSK